jgi:tetratricopeptide (TPR) repeat protein
VKKTLLMMTGTVLFVFGQYVFADEATTARLDTCKAYYEDGDYQKAADSIKALLPLISDRREEAEAYKYLGFSYVMLDLINKAKDFFRVALEKFPQMMIDTLEVPPNISIVFKQAKLETQMEKGEILDKKVQAKNTSRIVLGSFLTAAGAVSTGTAGYFFYKGFKDRDTYRNATEGFDNKWSTMQNDFIIGGCATGVAAAALFFGTRLLFKKPAQKDAPQKVGIRVDGNSFALTVLF